MKSIKCRLVLLGLLASLTAQSSQAQNVWHMGGGDLEFALIGSQGAGTERLVSTLESGYNGAWWFGNAFETNPFTALAQTFSVDAGSTLSGVELRVAQLWPVPAKGNFEVALFTFDTSTNTPTEKLAAVQAQAETFAFPLVTAPVSSFDFSAFALKLSPTLTYALTITPLPDFHGGLMAVHGATDIYPKGSVYVLSPQVPEPDVVAMCLAGAVVVGVMGLRRRRVDFAYP